VLSKPSPAPVDRSDRSTDQSSPADPQYRTISAAAAARKLGFGKAKTLALIHDGRLKAKVLDGRIRVRPVDCEDFIKNLPDASKTGDKAAS
jgi:hypothetical protein